MKRGITSVQNYSTEKRKVISLTAGLSKEDEVKLHFHDYIELIYMESGTINLWIDGKSLELNDNELAVVNSNACHAIKAISEKCTYSSVRFLPSLLFTTERAEFGYKYIYPFISESLNQNRVFSKDFVEQNSISAHIHEILDNSNQMDYISELSQKVNIELVALAVFKQWKNKYIVLSQSDDDRNIGKIMSKAIEYIHSNNGNLKASQVADYCGISTIYFSKSFNSIMLMTYPEYSNLVKVKQAQKLLMTTEKTLTEIAQELGFSSCSHFIIQFKKVMNCTPAQFRRKWREVFQMY